jgi:predicted branched-subunit amino acid permease
VHGAGMMLIPVLMPLAQLSEHARHMPVATSLGVAALAVLVHSLAMLLTTGAIALAVYDWIGLDFLRRGWINLDLVWSAALIGMGLWLLLVP